MIKIGQRDVLPIGYFQIMFDDLQAHSALQRLKRCRERAEDARLFALRAHLHEHRDAYLTLASQWDVLADELENGVGPMAG